MHGATVKIPNTWFFKIVLLSDVKKFTSLVSHFRLNFHLVSQFDRLLFSRSPKKPANSFPNLFHSLRLCLPLFRAVLLFVLSWFLNFVTTVPTWPFFVPVQSNSYRQHQTLIYNTSISTVPCHYHRLMDYFCRWSQCRSPCKLACSLLYGDVPGIAFFRVRHCYKPSPLAKISILFPTTREQKFYFNMFYGSYESYALN